ncbi:putative thiazole-containing bacteriocin maturation protein [Pseudalkalibacillus sp. A8]|uniref:putative thiazole-containing bacteriocin maturation protein n=1 Tax=Pseudalkalibacillus sp. A8 TaxID=3382641 RepID=UPI0038B4BB5D
MTKLDPSMRLKVKGDIFFIADPNGGVYFRNNLCSFRIEGMNIDKWVEKLIPMFNGEHTLENLTEGLPLQYKDQVYKIAEMLKKNGFVRDVTKDRPHQLSEKVLQKYASQIELLENLSDSGAYRFQTYRQSKVLAVGSGPFFISLVSSLLESGLPKFHMLITDSVPTRKHRLVELVAHAKKTDPEVMVAEVALKNDKIGSWRQVLQPFDIVLYVSQEEDIKKLRLLQTICREEKKVFVPATILQQVGLAGPLVQPDSEGCWESVWRRIHQSAICKDSQHTFSSTAGAILTNIIVFEMFKAVTGITETERNNRFFMLNLETFEGDWHSFIPHPLVTGRMAAEWIQDLDRLLVQSSESEASGLFPYYSFLTSAESGIFHSWEEGDLKQLPLSQCRVQVADPLSEGPAGLLQEMICTGITHEEARREAGLSGIESYVSRMIGQVSITLPSYHKTGSRIVDLQEAIGVGAGDTVTDGIYRGLQKCLDKQLDKQLASQEPFVFLVRLKSVEDKRCQFYLRALTRIKGVPNIGLGEEVCGFPVVWVGTGDRWYSSTGMNVTIALQKALQQAVSIEQNRGAQAVGVSSVLLQKTEQQSLVITACEETGRLQILQTAIQVLKRNHKRLLVLDLALEPFLKKPLTGVFGVLLREEASR